MSAVKRYFHNRRNIFRGSRGCNRRDLALCGSPRRLTPKRESCMAERTKRAVKKGETPAVGLAAALKGAPELSDEKAARARVAEWLAEISRTSAGTAIKSLTTPSKDHNLADVVASIAEASPYLWELIRADPARFLALLEAEPEQHFAMLVGDVVRAGLSATDETDVMRALRRAKAEAALLIA